MSVEAKAALLAAATALSLLGVTFGVSPFLRPAMAAASKERSTNIVSAAAVRDLQADAKRGHSLFDHNCAHCHGDDARGDEGPSLYDLSLSDARIAKRIKEGVKGEMPKFGSKLNDADIRALIAYLRTLKS